MIDSWVKVIYEGEKFAGKVIKVVNGKAKVLCLSVSYKSGQSFASFERDNDAVFYEEIYQMEKQPECVKVGRKYLWKFQ